MAKQKAVSQLKGFMTKHGKKLVREENTLYTRKDGKKVHATRLEYDNGKSYLCTAFRFWTEQ